MSIYIDVGVGVYTNEQDAQCVSKWGSKMLPMLNQSVMASVLFLNNSDHLLFNIFMKLESYWKTSLSLL